LECQGHGERISLKDRYKSYSERKIVREKKILEVHIDKDIKNGQKINSMVKETKHQDWNQEIQSLD
jgi:DnaJ-class molecular chaperone